MSRPRKLPYSETAVYAEYWEEKFNGKSICMYAFGKKFISNYKTNRSGREIAKEYIENLKHLLSINNTTRKLKVKLNTYIVNPLLDKK